MAGLERDDDNGDPGRPGHRSGRAHDLQRYEIQARRQVRTHGVLVADEIDLAVASDLPRAREIARTFATAGYTSWVFRIEPGRSSEPTYNLIQKITPREGRR